MGVPKLWFYCMHSHTITVMEGENRRGVCACTKAASQAAHHQCGPSAHQSLARHGARAQTCVTAHDLSPISLGNEGAEKWQGKTKQVRCLSRVG